MNDEKACESFTQLLDRGLPTPAIAAQWCPTMDLLALLAADGQLHLYRLNWQKLWSVTPESPITSFCWRPDGKQLAVGQQDGHVLLLHTESGETQVIIKPFLDSVIAITWTDLNINDEKNQGKHHSSTNTTLPLTDRARIHFQPPLPHPPSHIAPISTGFDNFNERMGKREEASWPETSDDALSLVACADTHGTVALFAGPDLFLLALVTTPEISAPGAWINSISISTSLESIVLHIEEANKSECIQLIDIRALTSTVGLDVLRLISSYCTDVNRSLSNARIIASQIYHEWKNTVDTMETFKNTLNSLLQRHGSESDAQQDLLLLVTMGEYTPAMEQFLMSSMEESGLKKIARTVDASLCAAHALLTDRLIPEIELTSFYLNELRGFASSVIHRDYIGIKYDEICRAEGIITQLVVLSEVLRDQTTRLVGQYRTFFSWLTTALRRFPEDTVDTMMGFPLSHVDIVRSFLHHEFNAPSLTPLLTSYDLDSTLKSYCTTPTRELEKKLKSGISYLQELLKEQDLMDGDPFTLRIAEDAKYTRSVIEAITEQFRTDIHHRNQDHAYDDDINVVIANAEIQSLKCTKDSGLLPILFELQSTVDLLTRRPAVALSEALAAQPDNTQRRVLVKYTDGHEYGTSCLRKSKLKKNRESQTTDAHVPWPGALEHSLSSSSLTSNDQLVSILALEYRSTSRNGAAATEASPQSCILKLKFHTSRDTDESEMDDHPHAPPLFLSGSYIFIPKEYTLVDVGLYKNGSIAALLSPSTASHRQGEGKEESQGDLEHLEHGVIMVLIQEQDRPGDDDEGDDSDPHTTTTPVLFPLPTIDISSPTSSHDVTEYKYIYPPCHALDPNNVLEVNTARPRDGVRCRKIPYLACRPPFAVSATRGIGAVFAGQNRALLYDLEEDEQDGEGEEEGYI